MRSDRIIAFSNNTIIYRNANICKKRFTNAISPSRIFQEAYLQIYAEEVGIAVPHVQEVSVSDNAPRIISEYIRGNTLAHCMQKNIVSPKDGLYKLAQAQYSMHRISSPSVPCLQCLCHNIVLKSDLPNIVRQTIRTYLQEKVQSPVLCHGNFSPRKVICATDKKMYITDWADAYSGDAYTDVAQTAVLLALRSSHQIGSEYINIYAKIASASVTEIAKNLPIAASMRYLNSFPKDRDTLLDYIQQV